MEVQNKKGFEFVAYDTCYGNQLQQVLHQECIDVFNKAVTVNTSSVAYDHCAALCKTIDAAAVYNQEGFVDKASMVLDFCWTVLDYGQAVLEGAGLGIVGVAQHAYDHPITTIASVVAGEVVLGYQLAKVIAEVADIGITYAMNADEGVAKLDEYIKPLTHIIDVLSSKEMTMRSMLKCGTAVAVGFKAQTKLLGGLQRFYAGIRSNASMYIRSYPSATVEQYLPTPRGGLLNAVTDNSLNKVGHNSGINLTEGASKELFNFTHKTLTRMSEKGMAVPIQILKGVIDHPMHVLSDPQGTRAMMYCSQIWKDKKLYNIEVLYDKESNLIMHFLYRDTALGPLKKVVQ